MIARLFAALAAIVLAWPTDRATASPGAPPIFVDLEIKFAPGPPPIIPPSPIYSGFASFFDSVPISPDTPNETISFNFSSFDIGSLTSGGNYHTVFIPIEPCFGDSSCKFNFQFVGRTFPATPSDQFDTFAFLSDVNPTAQPGSPPIIPIDLSSLLSPGSPPIKLSGNIIAFDDPATIGEWDITVAVAAPGPMVGAGLPGMLAGFGAMLAWYRKRRAAI